MVNQKPSAHLLTNKTQQIHVNLGRMVISNSKCEKHFGIKIDNKLICVPHLRSFRKKVSQKLSARITSPSNLSN